MASRQGIALLWVAGFLVASCLFAAEPEKKAPAGPSQLKPAVSKETPPKVDGVLDDAIWKQAAVFAEFKHPDGTPPKGKARLLVAQDDKALYVAVECFGDAKTLQSLVANVTGHDGEGIWEDDDVELFLDPTGKAESYYQIIVNSKGATWDAYHDEPNHADSSWNPKYQAAAKVGKESWIVETALPWAIFDRTKKLSDTWAFQCLNVRQAGESEELQFTAVEGSSHQPDKFGKLVGVIGKSGIPATASAPATSTSPAGPK